MPEQDSEVAGWRLLLLKGKAWGLLAESGFTEWRRPCVSAVTTVGAMSLRAKVSLQQVEGKDGREAEEHVSEIKPGCDSTITQEDRGQRLMHLVEVC
jgi:hypothetical protein